MDLQLCSTLSWRALLPSHEISEWTTLDIPERSLLIKEGYIRGQAFLDFRLRNFTQDGSKDDRDRTRGRSYVRVLSLLRLDVDRAKELRAKRDDVRKEMKENKTRKKELSTLLGTIEDPFSPKLSCFLVYQREAVGFSVEAATRSIANQPVVSKDYTPFMISCPYPPSLPPPSHVLVTFSPKYCPSDPGALLAAVTAPRESENEVSNKTSVGVCVKGLDFANDWSDRLIEWIEGNRLMGATHIDFHVLYIPHAMTRVLEYYESTGFITVHSLSYPAQSTLPQTLEGRKKMKKQHLNQKRRLEAIPYNECLLRYHKVFDYLLPIDVDEIIVPQRIFSWQEYFFNKELELGPSEFWKIGSFRVRNAHFFEQLSPTNSSKFPEYAHMLRHTWRKRELSKKGAECKSFVSTRSALVLFNHYPLRYLFRGVKLHDVSPTDLVMMHFKKFCGKDYTGKCDRRQLEKPVQDESLLLFAEALLRRIRFVRRDLQI